MVNMVKKNKLITAANFRDFDWNKAKLFYHLAKCGGFTKAAYLAGIDQASLTRQMQALETQVGSRLVIRSAKGITLTRKGEELLEHVAPFFMAIRGFCKNNYASTKIGQEEQRKIRIISTHALASYVLSDIIIDYNKEHPNLIFEIVADDFVCDIILSDSDIAIRPYNPDTDQNVQGIIQEPLFGVEKKLYASREYLSLYGEPKSVDDLKNHKIIVISSNPKDYPLVDIHWILKLGLPEGTLHKPSFLSNTVECMINAAEKGMGIIGGYEIMSILKKANLVNILPDVSDKQVKNNFIYPEILQEDDQIMDLKNYLKKRLTISPSSCVT